MISESEEKKGQRAGAMLEEIMPENFIQSTELIKTKIQKLLKAWSTIEKKTTAGYIK